MPDGPIGPGPEAAGPIQGQGQTAQEAAPSGFPSPDLGSKPGSQPERFARRQAQPPPPLDLQGPGSEAMAEAAQGMQLPPKEDLDYRMGGRQPNTEGTFGEPAHPEYYGAQKPTNDSDRLNSWLRDIEQQTGSPEFYAKLREAFGRLETTRRLLPTDMDVVVQGGREFGKKAAGVEDTADLDEQGTEFARATEAYWRWVLGKMV